MIELNAVFEHEFQYSQQDVELFAKVTGDNNPIHLDAAYAATTMFKRPIMHGMLSAGTFSKVLGTMFPGEGTIYLSQSLNFKKPMYVDTPYVAVFKVIEVNQEKHRATIQTQVIDKASGEITVDGEAKVLNLKKI